MALKELRVESNIGIVRALITEIGKQLPFGIMLAINDTLKDAQKLQRTYQRGIFTVRRPLFVDRAVKIKPFATKRTLEGRMSIDPPGGRSRRDILTKFESGGRKQSRRGRHVAIPIGARRTKAGIVQRGQRPKALGLVRRGRGARGKRRTFVCPVQASSSVWAVGDGHASGCFTCLSAAYPFQPSCGSWTMPRTLYVRNSVPILVAG